jgi:hypothetical protein
MNKKRGTHSTQKKYFNTIPKSEFYGVTLGYALGLILGGFLRLETQIPQLAMALIGFGIGYYIDKKYYQEPDEPIESSSDAADESYAADESDSDDESYAADEDDAAVSEDSADI